MYIDTHCHLQFSHYDTDRSMVIGNAKKAGVKKFIVPGVDTQSNRGAISLSTLHPTEIFASIGFHPYEAQKITPESASLELESIITNHAVIAIGECGLDYHIYKNEKAISKKSFQKSLFHTQLQIASSHKLPVIIHARDAYEDIFDIFDQITTPPPGVIHCFSGGLEEYRFAQKRGLYIGIDGNVTYSKSLQHIISEIPLSQILLETDSPYLTPTPHRGKRNEPKYIPLVASTLAMLHQTTTEQVMATTTENAKHLFKIP